MKRPKLNISKKELYDEMVLSMHYREPTTKLVSMFVAMAEGVWSMFSYSIEEDRSDVVANCVAQLCERFHKYDFNKTNPFSFLTAIISNVGKDTFTKTLTTSELSLEKLFSNESDEE